MKLEIKHLRLTCRQSVETIHFAKQLTYFHGEMSSGKSSIPALVDYCLGAKFPKTPALDSELVSVQLSVLLGDNDVLIERVPANPGNAQVSWETKTGGRFQCLAPLQAQPNSPVFGDDVFSLSDLLLRLMDVGVIRVRKRTFDADSPLVRLSLRDILEFSYLDQDHLDSDFFFLTMPIRQEKSQDALRFFVGYMSDRLNELQNQLQDARQNQRAKREAAVQIQQFLEKFGFASVEKIDEELDTLNSEARGLLQAIERLKGGYRPETHIADEERQQLLATARSIGETEEALRNVEMRIREQEALESELISLKFKMARSTLAHAVLEGVEFQTCPACGSPTHSSQASSHCYLCRTPADQQPKPAAESIDVFRQDVDARIDDLKQSAARHKAALQTLTRKLEGLRAERRALDQRLSDRVRSFESEFLARTRSHEKRISAIQERSTFLERIKAMPAEIARVQQEADALSGAIATLRRKIEEEEAKLVTAEKNYKALEENYKEILQGIAFPDFSESDQVVIDRRTLLPTIYQAGEPGRSYNFFEAGSGGKKTLLKICFALALHKTASENGLPVPSLLMIDSPMKNITPDVNPAVFKSFFTKLYDLMSNSLHDWQIVIIDQSYFSPPATIQHAHDRLLKRNDPKHPRLISYYFGA